ncbi:MAG: 3'(2'),5'-bisphosphate nucleotidase [Mesorhizobium amorphae]|nr:MAG: 3'(2'),5'-bisphosphate nucleotidase [Mesorhizobium amorphae]
MVASPHLSALIDIACEAGRVVMEVYADAECGERVKADASPVTEADLRGEAMILAGLARVFPGVPVVAEEEAAAGRIPETVEGRFLLVDALDGTREFLARNGEFTVNIALVEDGRPVMGVVHAPAFGLTFAGSADGAVMRIGEGGVLEPIHGRQVGLVREALLSRSRGVSDETRSWLARHSVEKITLCGSSLKFCRLACGEADLYPCLGPTMEWDTAAGQAVLEAAGGSVLGLDGLPVRYNKRGRREEKDFLNAPFVAYGDPSLAMAASEGTGSG